MDPSSFLPSLERARTELGRLPVDRGLFHSEVDLLAHEPDRVDEIAGILLLARALRRRRWAKDVELSRRLYARYPRERAPAPTAIAPASHKWIIDDGTAREQTCSACVGTPGKGPCAACGGAKQVVARRDETLTWRDCTACAGTGRATCTTCDGVARVMRARVEFVDDTVVPLARLFLPEMPTSLAEGLRAAMPTNDADEVDTSAQDALAFETTPARVESAYRGASALRQPDFHGFDFRDAYPRALAAFDDLRRLDGLVAETSRTFARPIVLAWWTVRGARWSAALFVDHEQRIRAVAG